MDKSEFERIKAEEKAHLQKLRALKQQHRGAQRMASTANALNAMRNPELEAETDAMTDKLMRDAALSEARFELAAEGLAPVTGNAEGQVSVGNELPGANGGDKAPTPKDATNKNEETTNYEISRVTKTEIAEGGRIKRLSVAVVLDAGGGATAG